MSKNAQTFQNILTKLIVDRDEEINNVVVITDPKNDNSFFVRYWMKDIYTNRHIFYIENETKALFRMFSPSPKAFMIINFDVIDR